MGPALPATVLSVMSPSAAMAAAEVSTGCVPGASKSHGGMPSAGEWLTK